MKFFFQEWLVTGSELIAMSRLQAFQHHDCNVRTVTVSSGRGTARGSSQCLAHAKRAISVTAIIIIIKECNEPKLGGKGAVIKMCEITLNNNGLLPRSERKDKMVP